MVDTVVFVRGTLSCTGESAFVVQSFKRRLFLLLAARLHLEEIFHTLSYPRLRRKYALSGRVCKRIVGQISARRLILPPAGALEIFRDPDDNYLVELALLGHADFLVSEDADLWDDPAIVRFLAERGARVIRVSEFGRILRAATAEDERR